MSRTQRGRRCSGGLGWIKVGVSWLALGLCSGCGFGAKPPAAPTTPFKGMSLSAGVYGNPATSVAIEGARGEWIAASGAEISVKPLRAAGRPDPAETAGVDVLIFPGEMLGDLVDQNLLRVLDDSWLNPAAPSTEETPPEKAEPKVDRAGLDDYMPVFRDQVIAYGPDRMALALGGGGLVLALNRSALEAEAVKAAAKAANVALEPPKTWSEFDDLAKFLHGRDWNGDGNPDAGLALSWANDPEGLANSTFLARALSSGQHRDQYTFLFDGDRMLPRLASPPFVETLDALKSLTRFGPPDASRLDAEAAREAFRSGKVAMLIDFAENSGKWGKTQRIKVAQLPGSNRVYDPSRKLWESSKSINRPSYLPRGGGYLIGVSSSSKHPDAALDFAVYLSRAEVSNRLQNDLDAPMLPARISQAGKGLPDSRNASVVDVQSWNDAVGRSLNAPRVVPGIRVPDASGYLGDLAKGRLAALEGKSSAEALGSVAGAWNERTKALGLERQVWHYRRSLISLVTLPEPPPRPATSSSTSK